MYFLHISLLFPELPSFVALCRPPVSDSRGNLLLLLLLLKLPESLAPQKGFTHLRVSGDFN